MGWQWLMVKSGFSEMEMAEMIDKMLVDVSYDNIVIDDCLQSIIQYGATSEQDELGSVARRSSQLRWHRDDIVNLVITGRRAIPSRLPRLTTSDKINALILRDLLNIPTYKE